MNRNVEQCPDETVSARIRAILAPAHGRIRRWFGGFGFGRANREASLRIEEPLTERARIARELHDSVLHGVLEVCVLAHTELDRLPADSPCRPPLHRVLRMMERVVDEGRAVLLGLRSSIPASRSLEEAICDFGGELVPGSHIRYRILVNGRSKPLKPEVQEQICHIAREALVNAVRHAQATIIETEIDYLPRELRVHVRDNGCGMDPGIVELGCHSNLGLESMRERAESIGAQLRIWSRPNAGTEVEVTARGAVLDGFRVM